LIIIIINAYVFIRTNLSFINVTLCVCVCMCLIDSLVECPKVLTNVRDRGKIDKKNEKNQLYFSHRSRFIDGCLYYPVFRTEDWFNQYPAVFSRFPPIIRI